MAFAPFSHDALDQFLERHPLPPAGRRQLEVALARPARNVQGTTRNMVSDNPGYKMPCNVQAESERGEAPAVLDYTYDDDVFGFLDQPFSLELDYLARNNKRVRTSHTPDYLVMYWSSGFCLEEWKLASTRTTLADEKPGRYVYESGSVCSPPAEAASRRLGFEYRIRFSDEIPQTRTLNQRFLVTYLEPRAENLYRQKLPNVLAQFNNCAFLEYKKLLQNDGVDQDTLNWAIATGHLTISWDQVLMSQPQEVVVFRDHDALRAYQLATLAPRITSPLAGFSPDIFHHGQPFVFDGVRFVIDIIGVTKLFATSEHGEAFSMEWRSIEHAYYAGDLILEYPPTSESYISSSQLRTANPLRISKAIEKLEILQKLENNQQLETHEIKSERTYCRWRAKIAEAEIAGLTRIEGLLDNTNKQGFRGPHIDACLSRDIDARIDAAIRNPTRPSLNKIFGDIKRDIEATGRTMISKTCFYVRAKNIESVSSVRDSKGYKVAYQLEPMYWVLNRGTPVHFERPLECVHIDHTLLIIRLISSLTGEEIGRPWLTLAVDAFSRRVVGFYLSFHPPCYISVMIVLLDVFQRFGRKPDCIVHDWGPEFRKKELQHACTSLHIRKLARPKSAPRFGNCIERFFGTTEKELIANLPGNTKATKNVRTLTRQIDPSLLAGLTMANLYFGLEEFFFHIYDNCQHSTLLKSPRSLYDFGRIRTGERPHRLVRAEDVLPVVLPTVRGGNRTIDSSRGIYVNYEYYGNPRLNKLHLDGTTVPVKVVPFHPGLVLAYADGEWLPCKSKWHDELQAVPEFIRRAIFEEWLIAKRTVGLDKQRASESVCGLIEELNQAASENKNIWKNKDTRRLSNWFGSIAADTPHEPVRKLSSEQSVDDLFSHAIQKARNSGDYGKIMPQ